MGMNGGATTWRAVAAVACLILAAAAPAAAQKAPEAPSPSTPDAGKPQPDLASVVKNQQKQIDAQQKQIDDLRKALEAQSTGQAAPATTAGGDSKDEAELQSILASAKSGDGGATAADATEVQAFQPSFKLYGFADMGLQKLFGKGLVAELMPTDATNFALGNVNIYFDAQPSPQWRFLTEVRFTLLPDGALTYTPTGTTSTETTVGDVSSPAGVNKVKWSGIVLERAHIDYMPRDWINVRVGYFLTPFGIWNVDHGTPTLIPTLYPIFMLAEMFPRQQLGIEVSGRVNKGPWEYGYHLYVSNGRTPTQIDITENKYVGGRFVVRTTRPFPMQFGLSGMVGWYDQANKVITFNPTTGISVVNNFSVQYAEQIVGADVSLDIGGLRVRGEGLLRRVMYRNGHRDTQFGHPFANRLEAGGYLLLAYRLPWGGLEPFVEMDVTKYGLGFAEGLLTPSVGLNIHFTPAVVLKTQYAREIYSNLLDHEAPPVTDYQNYLLARLAIAF